MSTELDAATTADIVTSLASWARITGGIAVMSLMNKPSPEVIDQFDDIMLLREGHTIYQGHRRELPSYLNLQYPPDEDFGDFVTAFLAFIRDRINDLPTSIVMM